jgi:hypothetical protein
MDSFTLLEIALIAVLIAFIILFVLYVRTRRGIRSLMEIITLTQVDLNEPIRDQATPQLPLQFPPTSPEPAYLPYIRT